VVTTNDGQDERAEEVTLELPLEAGATTVAVAGDFNDWSVESHRMRQREDGSFAITLTLEPGRAYQYRYWVDDERWENDWSADAYEPNEYGGDNSLLDLRPGSPRLQAKTPVVSEPPAAGAEPAPKPAKAKRSPAKQPAAEPSADAQPARPGKPAKAAKPAKASKQPAGAAATPAATAASDPD